MPTGGFLRTNFRRTGQQSVTAIGGGIPYTSFAGSCSAMMLAQVSAGASAWDAGHGAGLNLPFNGFIMGSIANSGEITGGANYGYSISNANISVLVVVSAYGAMSAWYGGGIYGSGYAIMPFAVTMKNTNNSNCMGVELTFTIQPSSAGLTWPLCGSTFEFIPNSSVGTPTVSVGFGVIWAGWVISSP
jgi:hypothetical protein